MSRKAQKFATLLVCNGCIHYAELTSHSQVPLCSMVTSWIVRTHLDIHHRKDLIDDRNEKDEFTR